MREPLVLTGNPGKARPDVRRADPDHLLVAVDLLARSGRERRRGGDRVGQGYQRDAEGSRNQEREVGPRARPGGRGQPLGYLTASVSATNFLQISRNGGQGTYNMKGGTLNIGSLDIGNSGTALLEPDRRGNDDREQHHPGPRHKLPGR